MPRRTLTDLVLLEHAPPPPPQLQRTMKPHVNLAGWGRTFGTSCSCFFRAGLNWGSPGIRVLGFRVSGL